MFTGLPSDLRRTPYFAGEDELIIAGLGSSLKKCLTVTGGGCCVDTPVSLKLFFLASRLPSWMSKAAKLLPAQ